MPNPGHHAGGLLDNTLVIILAGGKGDRLQPLTQERSKPAVPIGGLYRIIDFTLSNCVNTGLRRMCLLTQYKSISLARHLRLAWNICSEELGEFILALPPQHRITESWYRGTADAVYQNIYTIEQEQPKHVLILAGDHLYKMNYGYMLGDHYMNEADVTISCLEVPIEEARRFGVMKTDDESRVVQFVEKPPDPRPYAYQEGSCLASMGIYVFETNMLVETLEADAQDETSSHDFGKDLIPKLIETHDVFAYPFGQREDENPYWRDIGTIHAFWQAHMELLSHSPEFDLFDSDWPIRTYLEPHPPAKLMFDKKTGASEGIYDSMVSPGCVIRGGRIANSYLSPGVQVDPGAVVEDSILLNDVKVGPGARISHAIIDKQSIIRGQVEIGLNPERDRQRFRVCEDGITVVGKQQLVE